MARTNAFGTASAIELDSDLAIGIGAARIEGIGFDRAIPEMFRKLATERDAATAALKRERKYIAHLEKVVVAWEKDDTAISAASLVAAPKVKKTKAPKVGKLVEVTPDAPTAPSPFRPWAGSYPQGRVIVKATRTVASSIDPRKLAVAIETMCGGDFDARQNAIGDVIAWGKSNKVSAHLDRALKIAATVPGTFVADMTI